MRNFLSTSLVLALVISGAMVLSHVPQGFTAPSDTETGRVVNLSQASTVPASRYQVSGDRQGQVIVKDAISGKIIRTFQMDRGVVVRETFLLDGGRTVAASQKDHAVFWDLATEREIQRFPQRIYGFSHDEKRFFTWHAGNIFLYSYSDLTLICKLTKEGEAGTELYRFSPDNRFLAIVFFSGFPSNDENYPYPNMVDSSTIYSKLFNLQNCQGIQEFSNLRVNKLGVFTLDSKFYDVKDDYIYINGYFSRGSWRFDLTTYQVQKLSQ